MYYTLNINTTDHAETCYIYMYVDYSIMPTLRMGKQGETTKEENNEPVKSLHVVLLHPNQSFQARRDHHTVILHPGLYKTASLGFATCVAADQSFEQHGAPDQHRTRSQDSKWLTSATTSWISVPAASCRLSGFTCALRSGCGKQGQAGASL